MNLDVKVMAHVVRAPNVADLLAQLDREVEVVWDLHPEPSPDPARRWETGRRAWEAIDPASDYGLVLQDDIAVCSDLIAGLEKALNVLGPDGLASAYTGTGKPAQANVRQALRYARTHGHSWTSTRSLNWGPAIVAPTHTIPSMLDWAAQPLCEVPHPGTTQGPHSHAQDNYDYRVGVYYRDLLGWRTWYTVPSLVEHKRLPSLVGHGAGLVRQAHQFHDGSALDIDWTQTPTEFVPELP